MSAYSIATRGLAGRKVPQGVLTPMGELLLSASELGLWYDPSDMSTLFQDSAGTVPVTAAEQPVGRILDKSGRGNHASQDTSTKRPVLSARVNLLTKTEEFGDAVWSKVASTISANTAETLDPLGGNSADKLSESATASGHYIDVASVVTGLVSGQSYTRSLYVKSAGRRWVVFNMYDGASRLTWFDVENGVVGTNAAGSVATIQSAGNGWYRCSVTRTISRGSIATGTETQLGDGLSASFVGDVTKGIYIWGASLVPAYQASLPYQRVNTATEYDADPAKFPAYLRFDGVDDALQTGNIDFTSTDKMTVWAGVTKLSDVAGVPLYEFGSPGSVNGFHAIWAPADSSQPGFSFASRGSITSAAYLPLSAPVSAVLSGMADIGGDFNTLRCNGAIAVTNNDQGVGNYGNNSLFIGARGGNSLYFNGRLYSLIVRGAQSSLSQIEATEAYIKQKMRLP